ncbi:peptidyl-tRNA hydrolase [Mustelus asterias]
MWPPTQSAVTSSCPPPLHSAVDSPDSQRCTEGMPGSRKHSTLKQDSRAPQRTVSSCPCLWQVCRRLQDLEPPPPDSLHRIMVVGMGNYQIQSSRCSVGMATVNILALKLNVDRNWHLDRRCDGKVMVTVTGHYQIVLLKPQQLMKMNGVSVRLAAEVYQVEPEDIFIVHDQIYMPLGMYLITSKEENIRNHSGVISCMKELKSNIMPRIMIGIGPAPHTTRRGLLHHKLGRFSEVQQRKLMQVLEQCTNHLLENLGKPRVQAGGLEKMPRCALNGELPPDGKSS